MGAHIRNFMVFILTVALATVLVSATSTHIILTGLSEIGVALPLDVRMSTVGSDILTFGPTLAAVLTIGLLIAFLAAAWIIKNLLPMPILGYSLAGFAAVVGIMYAIYWFYYFDGLGAIHPVPAARTLTGVMAMSLGGGVAGFFFANFHKTRA